ncbi:hypothetical protein [Amycolatopsis nigrescens]|uniref:hypothetical protein n=1 Tax=Amycolatopsis nigrescens TaxID=381445 RepID=UPI00037AA0B1|nr:hypothetical protein [Amycolatopsis nigrescens]
MRGDWYYDAVRVEIAYRAEDLNRAGRRRWVAERPAGRKPARWRRRRPPEVQVPEQRRADHDETAESWQRAS